MKKIILSLAAVLISAIISAQDFNQYFADKTVRMNYVIAGNSQKAEVFLSKFVCTDTWAGTRKHLTQSFEYGPYKLEVLDKKSGKLIYNYSFSSLFAEWQTTSEAENLRRGYREAVRFPLPKADAVVKLYQRDTTLAFKEIFSTEFSPNSYFTNLEKPNTYPTERLIYNGDPKESVDLVIVPEGYTDGEMDKFKKAATDFANHLFEFEPFKTNKQKFNVNIVMAPSPESGVDFPAQGIWKKTLMDFNYSTFDMDRYLTSENYWAICDVASSVAWDHVIVLVNSEVYGGGGIYNYYSVFSAENKKSIEVLVHEFGHAFAGLGDEYQANGASDSYPTVYTRECYEPNLTTLVDFASKWQDLVEPKTPIPTPSEKKYAQKVGAFEGGGYTSKGIYRPMQNCMMRELETPHYCPVCQRVTQKVIEHWIE